MKFKFLIPVFIIGLAVTACNTNPCPNGVKGEFTNLNGLDGCGMLITLEDGKKINPVNLTEFDVEAIDGKKVWIEYAVQKDMMSICMVGEMVEVKCISYRE